MTYSCSACGTRNDLDEFEGAIIPTIQANSTARGVPSESCSAFESFGGQYANELDTSKYRVSCGTIAPEGREAVTDRCRSQLGGVDLRREDRSAASSDRLACSGRGGSG